jgi:hypothetical protein
MGQSSRGQLLEKNMMIDQLPKHSRLGKYYCRICGTEITRSAARGCGICDHWKCRIQHHSRLVAEAREHDQRQAERFRQFQKKLVHYRNEKAVESHIVDADDYQPVCVPHFSGELVATSEARRQKLRDHLAGLIEAAEQLDAAPNQAAEEPQEQDPKAPAGQDLLNSGQLPVLLASACATCCGRCCMEGAEEAYLNAANIRQYMDANPVAQANEIIDDYVSRIPDRTYAESCIFHGQEGCGLPRQMRSDVCNHFECNALNRISTEFPSTGRTRLFLVASETEQLSRYRFLDSSDC